ncbi:MAG TPA: gliding motility-associated C-terminal domain-containing protein, partial [Bacteroidia bacterium]
YAPDYCGGNFIQFKDSSLNAISWNWNFGDTYTSALQNPSHTYSASGTFSVTLTTSNSIGCPNTKDTVVIVPPFSQLYIPTSFTPNGDGNNDIYYVFGKCLTDMTFRIYDRWGEKIFETTDVNTGWDGMYKGEKENAGVFIYSFEGTLTTGEKVNQKGNITLIR